MKKLLLPTIAILLVVCMTSFNISNKTPNPSIKTPNSDKPFCIEIECKKDPKCKNGCVWFRTKIVIYAFNGSAARSQAQDLHPGCKISAPWEGTCK